MFDAREYITEQDIVLRIESYLLCDIDRIKFANKIMTYFVRNKGEQSHCWDIVQCKKEDVLIF